MSEKVKVSRKIADEIEYAKKHDSRMSVAIQYLLLESSLIYGEETDLAIKGIVNGYEVEQTPEEKLVEYYKNIPPRHQYTSSGALVDTGYPPGRGYVEMTLNILGITIPGINGGEDNG